MTSNKYTRNNKFEIINYLKVYCLECQSITGWYIDMTQNFTKKI